MHVPLWFILMPAIVFLIDVCILLLVARKLMSEIRKAVAALESTAHDAVTSAAGDVRDQITSLLPKRPEISDNAATTIGAGLTLLGVDAHPLREWMSRRVRSGSVSHR